VQINQNPASSPNPVGPQAPPAPVTEHKGSEHRTQSRREALQAAFDRASSPPPAVKPEVRSSAVKPGHAVAKPGHNNPPEATPKLDLKKRPTDQPAQEAQPRDRGRFAPRQDATNQAENVAPSRQNMAMQGNAGTDGQPAAQTYKQLPPHAPYAAPPARMAEHGKREWANTPEAVRGEVHRVQAEFAKAYTFFKDSHEAFKPIKKFHQMAQEHGTTLEKALTAYTGMEQRLRSDPVAGMETIVNNLDLKDPQTGQKIGLRDFCYYVLNQSPEQLKMVQQGNQQQAAAHQIGALHQEVKGLKDTVKQWQDAQQYEKQLTYTRSAVDQFADTHPRIDEKSAFGEVVKNEISLGFDLETAYRRAELLLPATHAAQTRTPPAQTRPSDRSISGAPGVAPSDGASRKPKEPSPTPRAAFQNAMHRLNGAH